MEPATKSTMAETTQSQQLLRRAAELEVLQLEVRLLTPDKTTLSPIIISHKGGAL